MAKLESTHPKNDAMAHHLLHLAELPDDYWWHVHRFRLVSSFLGGRLEALLDYGCGSGNFLRYLLREKSRGRLQLNSVSGCDINSAARELVTHQPDVRFLTSEEFRSGASYDAITMLDVLEHVQDDVVCLRDIRAHLSAKGRLIITVPGSMLFWSAWDLRLGHYRRYSKSTLNAALAEAGFRVERSSYFFAFLSLPAMLRRWRSKPGRESEFPEVGTFLNKLLLMLCRFEEWCLRRVPIPFGTSLLAVATPDRDRHGV